MYSTTVYYAVKGEKRLLAVNVETSYLAGLEHAKSIMEDYIVYHRHCEIKAIESKKVA